MKKLILLGLIALTVSTQAYYDDYKYKKRIKKGYEFGFDLSYQNDFHYKEKVMLSGISSKYIKNIGRTGFNYGLAGGLFYKNKHTKYTKEYNLELSGRFGIDSFYKNLNVYEGVGIGGLSGLENVFVDAGLDYHYSDDLIFNLNFRTIYETVGKKNKGYQLGVGIIIPFNHY